MVVVCNLELSLLAGLLVLYVSLHMCSLFFRFPHSRLSVSSLAFCFSLFENSSAYLFVGST